MINARGMNTMASGSLMPKPVLDAIAVAVAECLDVEFINDCVFKPKGIVVHVSSDGLMPGGGGAKVGNEKCKMQNDEICLTLYTANCVLQII